MAAACFAVGDWGARARHIARLEYVCKPATLVALTGGGAGRHPCTTPAPGAPGSWRLWRAHSPGDILLMLPTDMFVAGLAAFLVGHVCYVAGFWSHGPGACLRHRAAVVVVVVVAGGRRILGALRSRRSSRVPVALYMAVISVMLATALGDGDV